MARILIGRHGQDGDNAEGILNGQRDRPLTQTGIRQAYALAEGIKAAGIKIKAIRSSPLQRAHKTGEVVAKVLNIEPPRVLQSLIERDFGIMTGKEVSSIESMCAPHIIKSPTITYFLNPPGAETFEDLLRRAERVFDQVKVEHEPDESVLLIAHGDIGKMLYAKYYDLDWRDVLTAFHLGNCELLSLDPGPAPKNPHIVKVEQHNH